MQKRPEYIKRDLRKRPAKETNILTDAIHIFICKRDLYTSKETCKRELQKRPTY